MYVTKAGVVTQHAGMIFNNNLALTEPADGQPHTFTKSCPVSQNLTILASNNHMQKTATHFTASVGQTLIYDTDIWSDPPMLPPPGGPLMVTAGSNLTWSCTYAPTTTPLTFGESSQNIMCIEQSVFYPVANIANPIIGCNF